MALTERLAKIRSSPRLQNQQQTAVVLGAVEETLSNQGLECTPSAYFAALLSLLCSAVNPGQETQNKDTTFAVVYLLDLVTPEVPPHLLRSKFSQILSRLASALSSPDAEAPLIRSSIGCLESLLLAQEAKAWALPTTEIGPRRAVAGLLKLAVDQRPKVRKRAQDALAKVLSHPPPSPSVDHPVADLCAETALQTLLEIAEAGSSGKKHHSFRNNQQHEPGLIHALQLIKTIASACEGWPIGKIDPLCQILLNITRSSSEHLTMVAFEIFEVVFASMAADVASSKLPRLLEVISDIQPSQNDSQLLPPWIAVISRGYDVSAQIYPDETFQKLPELFAKISEFLSSPSHNIRISSSECLVSFIVNCIPVSVILDMSILEEKVVEKLCGMVNHLLSVKYQASWVEVFTILGAMFDRLRWRVTQFLASAIKSVGDLRGNDAFMGKKEADNLLGRAVSAIGSEAFLKILPLNLSQAIPNQPGRAWLLPILRDSVTNTNLTHFKSEFIPLSERLFQKILAHNNADKTMEIKIYETLIQQIWSILPGYCDLPIDLKEGFDQPFAELLSNLLYQQPNLRTYICRSLQNLVDSNKSIITANNKSVDNAGEDVDFISRIAQSRVTLGDANQNLEHLAQYSGNLLAVLFNVYSQTLPHYRGYILTSINAYLSISPPQVIMETFSRVAESLDAELMTSLDQPQQQNTRVTSDNMPPISHTLMDLVITISVYLPRDSFPALFTLATRVMSMDKDSLLQKKVYKLVPRLSESSIGRSSIVERNSELQRLFLQSSENVTAPARRDRLMAISKIVECIPNSDLHFIPAILPEVVVTVREVNEKARLAAFDLLVAMGDRMKQGGVVINSNLSHMPPDAPNAKATLEEYFTMVSAGLAGSTPHMISSSVTATARILYQFKDDVSESTITNLHDIMDMFLQSPNREIVRSVLGFVKVSITVLPINMMLPRLKQLIPILMSWSHEHKGHFRAKVKHITERLIRRFGYEVVEQNTPDADKNLVKSIRKARERSKRKKLEGPADANQTNMEASQSKSSRFETGYEDAVYGDDSESDMSQSDSSDNEVLRQKPRRKETTMAEAYIHEDEKGDPLDLLDKRALGNISSTRPLKKRSIPAGRKSVKVDEDGKLIFDDLDSGNEHDDGLDVVDGKLSNTDGSLKEGINAYIEAIRGRNAAQRGQKGKLKFTNKHHQQEDEDDEMDMDDDVGAKAIKSDSKSPKLGGSTKQMDRHRITKNSRRPLGFQKSRLGRNRMD